MSQQALGKRSPAEDVLPGMMSLYSFLSGPILRYSFEFIWGEVQFVVLCLMFISRHLSINPSLISDPYLCSSPLFKLASNSFIFLSLSPWPLALSILSGI